MKSQHEVDFEECSGTWRMSDILSHAAVTAAAAVVARTTNAVAPATSSAGDG